MFGGRGIQAPEIILILLVIVLLFGARKLPETAKGMGQALRIFKREVKTDDQPAAPPTPEITQAEAPSTTVTPEKAPQEHERS